MRFGLLARETRFSENTAAFIGEQASNSVIARRFALSSTPSAITDSGEFRSYPDRFESFGASIRGLMAELGSTPQRWRRAVRIALDHSAWRRRDGRPSRLPILWGLRCCSTSPRPRWRSGSRPASNSCWVRRFFRTLGLALCGAMVDSAIPHFAIFIILCLATSYLIYADPRIGRLWIWVQVPVLTAFYLAIFDPGGFGWNDEQAFAGWPSRWQFFTPPTLCCGHGQPPKCWVNRSPARWSDRGETRAAAGYLEPG